VAFANIGELAIDALVASLNLQRLAAADDPNVLPCVGNNPYAPEPAGSLATAMELYGTSGEQISSMWSGPASNRLPKPQKHSSRAGQWHVRRLCTNIM
jgi:hypothetical protein